MLYHIKNFMYALILGIFYSTICFANNSNTAHIYIDLASVPALLQMIDAVQQPAQEPKLFIWRRIKTLSADNPTLKSINAIMADTSALKERDYKEFSKLVDEQVHSFYQKYPNHSFIIHFNMVHFPKYRNILDIIPSKKIKEIHAYEDSLGQILWLEHAEDFVMDFLYRFPTYIHVGFKNPENLDVPDDGVITFNFQEIAKKLSKNQQNTIKKLLGLKDNNLKEIFSKRPIAVFIDNPDWPESEAKDFMENLSKKSKIEDYTWVYKGHPRKKEPGPNLKILKSYVKNVHVLSSEIPLEVLILTGFQPDYVAGYASAAFYSFNKEQILGYFSRSHAETYLDSLLKLEILIPEKVFRAQNAY